MSKHEKVPETKAVKPNREQRRHPEKFAKPENEPISRSHEILEEGNQEVTSVRADSGHGKKTADKWNQ